MLNFDDTKIAFEYKSKKDLKKAFQLFTILKFPIVVSIGSKLVKLAIGLRLPINGLVKRFIFSQFCGGESVEECESRILQLKEFNVGTILDYSVEGQEGYDDFEKNKNEIIKTIRIAEKNSHIPFSVFKITGLGKSSILKKANKGIHHLNEEEKKSYDAISVRVDEICAEAYSLNVPVFIDAEDSWFQDVIDFFAEKMIEKYNKKTIIVYNTIQLYRHDRLDYLKKLHAKCQSLDCLLGVKLVRGAYMEKEREEAVRLEYVDPIHSTKEATDKDYDLALQYCIENIKTISICAGTHNEQSSLYLTTLMNKASLPNDDSRIYFAQLLGMSDHISFNLSKNGYNVAKYVPYGPIKEVLPYLIRRAEENTSVSGQTGRELSLIQKEIKRRKSV